jgi:RNA exonuclease 4
MSKVSRERKDSRNVSMGRTSRYAPFRVESKGKPPTLRNLAWSELGSIIQTGEHSSVEDGK